MSAENALNSGSPSPHVPVMLDEVLTHLAPRDGKIYVDGTFGAGGYSRAILESADCHVIVIDRDPAAIARAEKFAQEFQDRVSVVQGCFGDMLALVQAAGFEKVDGVVLDIGVSSMQIDDPERGFSFRFDGALDMRMDRDGDGQTAADIVNSLAEEALANILYQYGQERKSRRIARAIVMARQEEKIETTTRLADIIRGAIPRKSKNKIDPATRSFQALRIAVNDELGELARALNGAEELLAPQGRLVVVSFHSLEDGIVKGFLYARAGRVSAPSRHMPEPDMPAEAAPSFILSPRKALTPTEDEVVVNPRARSAKLRGAIRTEAGQ